MYASARETLDHICAKFPEHPRDSAIEHGLKGAGGAAMSSLLIAGAMDEPSVFRFLLGGVGTYFGLYGAYHLGLASLYTAKWLNPPPRSDACYMTAGRFTSRPALVDRVLGERVVPVEDLPGERAGLVVMNGLTVQRLVSRRPLLYDDQGSAARGEHLELVAHWQGNPLSLDLSLKRPIQAAVLNGAFCIVARPNGKGLSVILYDDAVT